MADFILMPQMGVSEESALLSEWKVKEGDVIKLEQPLFALETGKSSFEELAKYEGTLLKILVPAGEEVAVGAPVAVIGKPGENFDAPGAAAAEAPAAAPAVTPPKAVTPPPVSAPKPTGPKMTRLIMRGDTGEFATRAAFRMDQKTLARASSQARFADGSNQFAVQVTDGNWSIVGNSKVANPTVLNGNEVGESPVQLKDGDVIALKGRSSGKIAMELKVQIVSE
jgi:pyruvate/2-oxoglutarate dehydrogenase complex dihydrolipoamide acyltransferase (E2) component